MMEVVAILFGTGTALLLSLWVGHHALAWLTNYADKKLPPMDEPEKGKDIPGALTGFIERAAFTLAWLYTDGSAYIPGAMLVWLTLKMAANWNKDMPLRGATDSAQYADADYRNRWAFAGLLKGFVSMCFAAAGGVLGMWLIKPH